MCEEYGNFWDLLDTTNNLYRIIWQSLNHYSTSQRRWLLGSGDCHSKGHLKTYETKCARNLSYNSQTSVNGSMCKWMLLLMAWELYSHRREKFHFHLHQNHLNFFLLLTTWLHSWRQNGTMTSMNESYLQLLKPCSTGDSTWYGLRNLSSFKWTTWTCFIESHSENSIGR